MIDAARDADSTDKSEETDLGRPIDLDSSEYNRLADAAEIEEIRLVKSSFVIEPAYFDPGITEHLRFKIDNRITEPAFDPESRRLFGGFEYSVEVDHQETTLLKCEATYVVIFSVDGEFEDDLLMYFVRRIGRNASYPYFREFTAAQSWASGANLPILPIMKTRAVKKKAADID